MMSSQSQVVAVVAVLVAAALVQVTAFPMEAETPDKDTCERAMLDAIKVLRDLDKELEEVRGVPEPMQDMLNACKTLENPDKVSLCETQVKFIVVGSMLEFFRDTSKKVEEGEAALAQVAPCRPQGRTDVAEVQPRDLNTCFTALDESRGVLAELSKLIEEAASMGEGSNPEEVRKCLEAGRQLEECAHVDLFDQLLAALNNVFTWKNAAQDTLNRLEKCMDV